MWRSSTTKALRSRGAFIVSGLLRCPPSGVSFDAEEALMPILSQIETRRARRALSEAAIPKETLVRLQEAAHLAPSCANSQSWRILTVTDPERLEALKQSLSAGNYWAKKAPAISAFVTSPDWDARMSGGRDYAFFDLGMAAMNYQLQAVEEGLYVHPIAGFDPAVAKEALGLPEAAVLMTLVILGFPGDSSHLNEKHLASESSERTRKPLPDVAGFDFWAERLTPPPRPEAPPRPETPPRTEAAKSQP
jgi:nitroreductase